MPYADYLLIPVFPKWESQLTPLPKLLVWHITARTISGEVTSDICKCPMRPFPTLQSPLPSEQGRWTDPSFTFAGLRTLAYSRPSLATVGFLVTNCSKALDCFACLKFHNYRTSWCFSCGLPKHCRPTLKTISGMMFDRSWPAVPETMWSLTNVVSAVTNKTNYWICGAIMICGY